MIKEKKSIRRRSPRRSKKPARNTNVETSGGVGLSAENSIQIGGDVVGRDKITNISADKIIQVNPKEGAVVNVVQDTPHEPQLHKTVSPPPRPPHGFVDRETELARLDQLIAANEAVIVFAPDGEGKSTLLWQAANGDAAGAMPQGVVVVEGVDEHGEALGLDDVIQCLFDSLYTSDPPFKANATNARPYLGNTQPLVIFDRLDLPQLPLRRWSI